MNSSRLIEAIQILDRYRDYRDVENIWFEHNYVIIDKTDHPLGETDLKRMGELGFGQQYVGVNDTSYVYDPKRDWTGED